MGSLRSCARARGFTLIEMMIVVSIVGVLSLIAVVAYRRWVRSSHVGEAQDMVAHIRAAEEAFYAENGGYLDVSGGLGKGHSYPSPDPGAFATQWGGPCSGCKGAGWSGLAVTANAPVYFGYSVISDAEPKPSVTVDGKALDLTNMNAPWYFVEADANLSGDGASYTHVYGMSGTNQIFIDGDGN